MTLELKNSENVVRKFLIQGTLLSTYFLVTLVAGAFYSLLLWLVWPNHTASSSSSQELGLLTHLPAPLLAGTDFSDLAETW